MSAYYNENDPFTAAWLRALIKDGLIADGEVDERSIADVLPSDLDGFAQCHFFAGIGGWSYALRLAGWPDNRAVWTGSCPCQPFSGATRGRQTAYDMWPQFKRLIASIRPGIIFGEQVPHARDWFDGVCSDVETLGYEIGAAVLPAFCVGKDHLRPRIYFACNANSHGKSIMRVNAKTSGMPRYSSDATGMVSQDGIPSRVAISGFGNAIVPQVAQAFIEAYMSI